MEERRQYPRADVAIAIRTGRPGDPRDVIRTVNLSATGVAYDSPYWVEPFTRLEIIFVFPDAAGEPRTGERLVRVEAVVMRTEPDEPDDSVTSYRVACSFTGIQAEDKKFVAGYVDRVLAGSQA